MPDLHYVDMIVESQREEIRRIEAVTKKLEAEYLRLRAENEDARIRQARDQSDGKG